MYTRPHEHCELQRSGADHRNERSSIIEHEKQLLQITATAFARNGHQKLRWSFFGKYCMPTLFAHGNLTSAVEWILPNESCNNEEDIILKTILDVFCCVVLLH